MKPVLTAHIAVAACATELLADGRLRLIPDGTFKARDGRPANLPGWRLTAETAPALLANLAARADRIVIDYEHQTLHSQDNGRKAPAAGWFQGAAVEYVPGDGLLVTPSWTDAAKAHISAAEYRYFSPVIVYDKRTGVVLDIQMGALTNYAAIDGLTDLQVAAAARFEHQPTEPPMHELMKLFGLAEDATEQQAIDVLTALQEKNIGLESQVAGKDQSIASLKAAVHDPAKFVPVAAVQELQAEIAALKTRQDEDDIEALVTQGVADGKLRGDAMQDWARGLDVAALKAYLDSTQGIAALKGNQTHGKAPEGIEVGALSDTDLAVCKQMGIPVDDFKATATATAAAH